MMLQLTNKGKIYFYLVLLLALLSIHNLNSINSINNFFKIKTITINSNFEKNLNQKILSSLDQFHNSNIFLISTTEIRKVLDNFNFLGDYEIRKEYPSILNLELKKTNILAYYLENNNPIFIGENGKKITEKRIDRSDLLILEGHIDIAKFLNLKNKLVINGFKLNDFVKFYSFKSNRWDLIYKNEIIIKLPIDDLDSSLGLLQNIIQSSNINDIRIIDLRIKNRIILS